MFVHSLKYLEGLEDRCLQDFFCDKGKIIMAEV